MVGSGSWGRFGNKKRTLKQHRELSQLPEGYRRTFKKNPLQKTHPGFAGAGPEEKERTMGGKAGQGEEDMGKRNVGAHKSEIGGNGQAGRVGLGPALSGRS